MSGTTLREMALTVVLSAVAQTIHDLDGVNPPAIIRSADFMNRLRENAEGLCRQSGFEAYASIVRKYLVRPIHE